MAGTRRAAICAGLLFLVCAALFPSTAAGQGQSGLIGGAVRDNSGGVLPGVTVEASSPALIEKVRTVVTDSQGVYRIIDLRPGVYTVTFTLPGFTTLRREGIEVSAGFAATVNAELSVGAVEETITVTGESPLVDVQSTTQHTTISSQLIADLPTAKHWANLGVLIPGVTLNQNQSQDVGGQSDRAGITLLIHGSQATDLPLAFDGMRYISPNNGTPGIWQANTGMIQEISFDTSGTGAEFETSGVRVNTIPKQGGNTFSGYFLANLANDKLQSDNLDAALAARGVPAPSRTDKIWDVNPTIGGPLKQDKLWFYFAYRYWGYNNYPPGAFHDSDPADFVFTPDLSRPVLNRNYNHSTALRLTWQTSPNSKAAVYGDAGPRCWCGSGLSATEAYESSTRLLARNNSLFQVTWNWVASQRLLIEAGQTLRLEDWTFEPQTHVPPDRSSITDTGRGITFRADPDSQRSDNVNWNGKFAASYITGSHSFKAGTQWFFGPYDQTVFANNNLNYTFLNGVPTSITLHAKPATGLQRLKMNLGVYAQDQWVVKRLTLNLGARFDYLNAYLPEQQIPALQYAGPRSYPKVENVPNWKDVSPRLGASYDLFGSGRTALKTSLGRYMKGEGGQMTRVVNPITAPQNTATTRAWNDLNGNFFPDCVLTNPVANGECGPYDNRNFGSTSIAIRYDPNAVTGWGTRMWNWEMMGGVQHQLLPNLSTEVSYHRRWWGNMRLTENTLVGPGDYDPYCVTAPVDSRLPGGGGYPVCGLFDITPAKFGQAFSEITSSEKFGKQTEIFDGIDVVANLRLPWIQFQGGTSTGRTKTNRCFVVDSPQELLHCDVRPPLLTQLKLLAIYNLPWWDIQTNVTFQSVPGPEILANWSVPNASVVPSLGRSLAGSRRSVTIPLVAPGTLYGERLNQVDLRVAKYFRRGSRRLGALLDVYNLFNGNAVLTQNNTFGSNWQRPTAILPGRLGKVGIQLDF